jgi:hypothetical protein
MPFGPRSPGRFILAVPGNLIRSGGFGCGASCAVAVVISGVSAFFSPPAVATTSRSSCPFGRAYYVRPIIDAARLVLVRWLRNRTSGRAGARHAKAAISPATRTCLVRERRAPLLRIPKAQKWHKEGAAGHALARGWYFPLSITKKQEARRREERRTAPCRPWVLAFLAPRALSYSHCLLPAAWGCEKPALASYLLGAEERPTSRGMAGQRAGFRSEAHQPLHF